MFSGKVGSNTMVLFTVYQALRDVDWSQYGSPTNGRLNYPAEKQRTEQHTLQMRRAEQHLDSLWKKVDSTIEAKFGGRSLGDLFPALDFSDRELQRTREWKPVASRQAGLLEALLSSSAFKHGTEQTSKKFDVAAIKNKVKTRGASTETGQDVALSAPPGKQGSFKLKPRSLQVFQTLFYQPSETLVLGQIKWLDFVHAMTVGLGFTYQHLQGSAWQFAPPSDFILQRGIGFHEPHPETKMSFVIARQMGRRLNRVYGWDRESFVALKEH